MAYTVVEADLKRDKEQILRLWERNAPAASRSRYAWIYAGGLVEAASWLVKTDQGDVVGSTGLTCRMLKVGDRTVAAGQAIDLVVDQGHRFGGAALALQRELIAYTRNHGFALVYAFPSPRSEAIQLRAGYRVLGALERWTKPLRSEGWLRDRLGLPGTARVLARLIDPVMWAASFWRYTRPEGVSMEITKEFDHRFDDLWNRASQRIHTIADRTAASLTWRFVRCPHEQYRTFTLSDREGRLLGYVVYAASGGTVRMADLLVVDFEVLDTLLPEFMIRMRGEGMSAVTFTYLGSEAIGGALRRWGFHRRPGRAHALVHVHDAANKDDARLDRRLWYLTEGDRDV